MTLVQLDFFAAHDLNGPVLHSMTSDDDYFEHLELNIRLRELGGATLIVSRQIGFGAIDSGIFAPEVFVRYLVPSIHATRYVWGNFLDLRMQQLVSRDEKGGERYTVSGPGPLFYLTRAIMWNQQLSGDGWRFDEDAGVVYINDAVNNNVGNITDLMRNEDAERPTQFIPDLTWNFDSDATSPPESAGWGSNYEMAEDFELRMGASYLDILYSLQDGISSPLDFVMFLGDTTTPEFRLDAFKAYGRDLTGTSFGAGVVKIQEGVNIESDLTAAGGSHPRSNKNQASGTSLRKATHALVRGKDGAWDQAVAPGFSPGDYAKAALVDYPKTDNPVQLERAGLRWLARQENGNQEFAIEIKPGFDPDNGLYMPGMNHVVANNGHVWIGDLVTLKTGQGSPSWLDYDNETQWVTGIDMALNEAAKDDTVENAALSWHVTLQFNVERGSANTLGPSSVAGGGAGPHHHPHGPHIRLCELSRNILAGLGDSSLKASDEDAGVEKEKAVDEDTTTRWSPPSGQGPTAEHWWAADVGTAETPGAFRYVIEAPNVDDRASAAIIYGSNDADAWTWLVDGGGILTDDPADNDWTVIGGWTEFESLDTGVRILTSPGSYRYFLVRAVAGGTTSANEFDIAELELWTNIHAGTSKRGARCNHGHRADEIAYDPLSSLRQATDVQAALDDTVLPHHGGRVTIAAHGNLGATETFDPADGNVHTGTLDDDCTVTLAAPGHDDDAILVGWFTQDGTGGRSLDFAATGGSFEWSGGVTPTIPDDPGVSFRIVLERVPGTTNDWVGTLVGASTSSVAALIVREVGGSDIDPVAEIEFDADDFVVTDQSGSVARVALTTVAPPQSHILLADGRATPFTFDDLLQADDGSDFLWSD